MDIRKCEQCGGYVTVIKSGDWCVACDLDWEWFMNLKVFVDLDENEEGVWTAPLGDERVVLACSTAELRELILRQPDLGGAK
jgi:hypothetical protein